MRFIVLLFQLPLLFTFHLFSSNLQQINNDIAAFHLNDRPLQKILLKNLEDKHFLLNLKNERPIPKIIHFIWLGQNPIPPLNQECIQSIRDLHPTWKIKLWTDADLVNSNFVLLPKILKCNNYGLKSDLLRYEILYKYGGVYLDVDFFAKKPFDLLCEQHSFFMCSFAKYTMNSLLGSIPKHPLLKQIVQELQNLEIDPNSNADEVLALTGPYFLTAATSNFLLDKQNTSDIVVYPPDYFFPNANKIIPKSRSNLLSNPDLIEDLSQAESFAIHLFTTTWIK